MWTYIANLGGQVGDGILHATELLCLNSLDLLFHPTTGLKY